jgi:hypothetical protein
MKKKKKKWNHSSPKAEIEVPINFMDNVFVRVCNRVAPKRHPWVPIVMQIAVGSLFKARFIWTRV